MFLPKSLNNSKSSKTLYEFNKDKENVNYSELIKEADYFTRQEFDDIFKNLDLGNFKEVNKEIITRSEKMANQIINGLNPQNDIFFMENNF